MTSPSTGDEDRIAELHAAINARDLDATVSCYAPHARFADGLEGGAVEGRNAIRAHFTHLFETIHVELAPISLVREQDGRLRVRLQVATRGSGGGLWQDGAVTVWYRLERGLIVEQDVDDSGADNGRDGSRHEHAAVSTLDAVLDEAFAAFNAHDMPRLRPLFHDEITWPNALDDGEDPVGKEAVLAYFARIFATIIPNIQMIRIVEETVDALTAEVQYSVESPDGHIWTDTRARLIYHFRDGLLCGQTILDGF